MSSLDAASITGAAPSLTATSLIAERQPASRVAPGSHDLQGSETLATRAPPSPSKLSKDILKSVEDATEAIQDTSRSTQAGHGGATEAEQAEARRDAQHLLELFGQRNDDAASVAAVSHTSLQAEWMEARLSAQRRIALLGQPLIRGLGGPRPHPVTAAEQLEADQYAQRRINKLLQKHQASASTSQLADAASGRSSKRRKTQSASLRSSRGASPQASARAQSQTEPKERPSTASSSQIADEPSKEVPDWSEFPRIWE